MSASVTPLARRCIDLAIAAAPAIAERVIDQAVAALQEEETRCAVGAERRLLAEAWLALLQQRSDWRERFPLALRGAPAEAPAPLPDAGSRRGPLALVDDDALVQSLEARRLTQLLAPRLEQPLAELDALMSAALGLATVQPESNPLRPQVFGQAMRSLMAGAADARWPALWTRQLAAPLAGEIATLYAQAVQLLRSADLRAASYRVLPVANPARPQETPPAAHAAAPQQGFAPASAAGAAPAIGGTGTAATPSLGGASWADLSHHELGDELFQHFLHSRTPPSAQPLAPAYYAQVDQQRAALEALPSPPYDPRAALRHRSLPPVERPHRAVGTASPLDDAVWGRWAPARERSLLRTRMKGQARQVGQVLGLELVRKLVDQVGRDPRLLAPVREAIVALEPALLRLALAQPRFFGDEEHGGRRLVERVAERSLRYNDEFGGEFQSFFGQLRPVFHALNETDLADEAPFEQALQHLEGLWSEQDALEAPGRRVAQEAMYFAEARDAEAAQIAWTLSQRSDLEGVPAVVQDFLYGPWSLVMAHARLTDGQRQIDPGGWNAVIADLLWSVQREQTLREPARLIATIPVLLDKLRGGLSLLGQEPAEHATFFQALEKLHRPVLKLRARQRQASAPVPLQEPEIDPALLSTERQQPQRPAQPWMTPAERQAAGFDAEASGPVPLQAPAAQLRDARCAVAGAEPEGGEACAAPAEGEIAATLAGLRQGSWVDLHARGQWRRASLTWVSNRSTLFMFVSHGGTPHSMTRRTLERLLRNRLVRPVAGGAVVQRALDELAQRQAPVEELAAA